ncbi:metallophosphoesterase [Aureibaculum marinum]|uniref:Metallophosphoesterase n=1 Tax=Aureibaculum marinum TaxID=2487930 RepID=A0A3N4NXX6_9FLAO|nr:metallophosphoesterase [Aureibaculum marinum]RPD97716.1 metallophosphoesterase [Aureibaculum marinum]
MSKTNHKFSSNRRSAIKKMGFVAGAITMSPIASATTKNINSKNRNRLLRIAHITDVHMRPEHNAPNRFKKCLADIKKHNVDFFMNGGDIIYAANYKRITRERTKEQWDIWNDLRSEFSEYEMYSCLGNHDMWWAAPDKSDPMYGKQYVVKQLKMPSTYYSFDREGWHFIILDSMNDSTISLGEIQREWLAEDLDKVSKETPILIMSHCPILSLCGVFKNGNHKDFSEITKIFYKHKDKKIHCISGHIHLVDAGVYNNVNYYVTGALSGAWWEEGDEHSAQKYWYRETPPGYAILDLFDDGTLVNTYHPHQY